MSSSNYICELRTSEALISSKSLSINKSSSVFKFNPTHLISNLALSRLIVNSNNSTEKVSSIEKPQLKRKLKILRNIPLSISKDCRIKS